MDNIEMLNYTDRDLCHFVLTVDIVDDDDMTWRVFLDKPAHLRFDPLQRSTATHGYRDIELKGKGGSPEDAYKDLLKYTAELLHHNYCDSKV